MAGKLWRCGVSAVERRVVGDAEADLAVHHIPYAYLPFAGESHGFRRAENIVTSLEAELSFYGQIMGFTPPGVPRVPLTGG